MLRSAGRIGAAAVVTAALVAPSLAFAAYDDVSLTTDVVLSVNGITLNVSGSTAAVESITVNASDFSVTLPPSSTFEVTAPNLNQIQTDATTGRATSICNTSESKLGFAPTVSTITVTITPISTLCSGGGSGGSAPSSSSSSSSASSPGTSSTITAAAIIAATPTVTTTPAATPASGLSVSQIQAILDVLASFQVDAATMASVKAALEGTTTGSVTSAAVRVFKSNLTMGSLGSEVKALQEYLNSHGYQIAASGPGSSGNETTKFGALTKAALIKYQKANGITPAVGYFGPITRAAMNAE
ncbi:peptidoglycan-binding protein [Candidatus Kaiserbacteria bacterium]|nr:peptidoglycan-binding protein [Candidatus Kaiserbacteria bacterium]